MRVFVALIVAVSSPLVACGLGAGQCVTGQSSACACSSGATGAQVCNAQGKFDACDCTATQTGSGGGTGGGTDGGSGAGPKRVFVTSVPYAPPAAPTVCQNVADSVSLGGKWVPWLSTDNSSALDKVTGNGPWKLLTGETAFANRGQLATIPTVPLTVTEKGTALTGPGPAWVWTGTLTGGTSSSRNCANWTSNSSSSAASQGDAFYPTRWTDTTSQYCGYEARVYCFEL